MGPAEWFVIGAIVVGAADEIVARSSLKSNSTIQLLLTILKRLFPSTK